MENNIKEQKRAELHRSILGIVNDLRGSVDKMTFAVKVKYVRAKLLVCQTELAKMVGVSSPTINRWETGKLEPTFLNEKKFEKFCNSNDITFKEFIK